MLSFLFLHCLSYNYQETAKKELWPDYPQSAKDDKRTPLSIWYAANQEDNPLFGKQINRKMH